MLYVSLPPIKPQLDLIIRYLTGKLKLPNAH